MNICALCGLTNAPLRDSHYLPAAFFRRMNGNGLPPVFMDARRVRYKAKQVKAKLLCDTCERRFKVGGEDRVIGFTLKANGDFPLRDLLLRSRPACQIPPRGHVYFANELAGIHHDEIVYFAASVFWRGCVFDWPKVDSDTPRVQLSQELETKLRDFLLARGSFPSSAVLQVDVALDPFFGMTFPDKITLRNSGSGGQAVGYFFTVFGTTFCMFTDTVAVGHGKVVSLADPPHPIFLTDMRMSEVMEGCGKLAMTASRVGRLAQSTRAQ